MSITKRAVQLSRACTFGAARRTGSIYQANREESEPFPRLPLDVTALAALTYRRSASPAGERDPWLAS